MKGIILCENHAFTRQKYSIFNVKNDPRSVNIYMEKCIYDESR